MSRRHLDDAALAALWTGAAATDGVGVTDPHLDVCAECRVRFAAFAGWMDDVRAGAVIEAEAAFPAERLAAQQSAILRRIEAAERPARVIAFPKTPVAVTSRPAPMWRWGSAGAAAGLIVGLGLGQLLDLRGVTAPRPIPAERLVSQARPEAKNVVPASAAANEDAWMLELEAAARPQYEALRAFDTFTPRAADLLPR